MQHNNQAPSETPREICARVKTATAADLAVLRRLVGPDLSRAELGEVAEAVKQIEVQMSSLGRELGVLLDCADGGAGLGEAVRDQLGGCQPGGNPEQVCVRAVTDNADIMAALRRLLGTGASRAQLGQVAEATRQIEAQVSSLQCELAGRVSRADGGAGSGEVLRDQLGVTNREAKHLSRMSRRLEEMPNTRAKLEAGEITMSNAAALANAAGECGARQVDDNRGLLAEAAVSNPDDFRKRSRRWANAHSPDRGEELLGRQKRQRKTHLFWSKELEMGILHAEMDYISFGQVRQALDKHTDLLRRDDSGGEVHPDDVRTNEQRRTDALMELITGRRAHTLEPLPDRGGSGKEPTQVVVVADLGRLDGSRPDGECEILGAGPVPPSVLGNLSPDTSVCGIIFGGKGRVLWLGRNQRLGNGAQRLAAAVRDKGCVRCDAPVHRTELHHLRDWYDGGPTDIDNLVSLCGPHHRELQEHNRELVKTGNKWQTRPRTRPPPPSARKPAKPPARAAPP